MSWSGREYPSFRSFLKNGYISHIFLIVSFTLSTCIDPYSPRLKGYESLLVVEGQVTDENRSYTVRLSRTMEENVGPEMITGATVSITDDSGNISYLQKAGPGTFSTDSTLFRGVVGRTYTLHITTIDGEEYESESSYMYSVPDIDSIFFARDKEFIENGTEAVDGIRIFISSKPGNGNKYFRWDFEEMWKFRVPSPQKYKYVDMNTIIPLENVKLYCWKTSKSKDVVIQSVYSAKDDRIEKKAVTFIASNKSDRLMIQYCILVKQYSVSKNEYEFWDNLKKVNENGGDIFAALPFPVLSNIHNVHNPKERVLGYFQVSAVKQKRKFISFSEIVRLKLPFFHYDMCERIEMSPGDYPSGPFGSQMTWDQLYEMYSDGSEFCFVEPEYSENGTLVHLVFAKPECADCELTGTGIKPDFWPDPD